MKNIKLVLGILLSLTIFLSIDNIVRGEVECHGTVTGSYDTYTCSYGWYGSASCVKTVVPVNNPCSTDYRGTDGQVCAGYTSNDDTCSVNPSGTSCTIVSGMDYGTQDGCWSCDTNVCASGSSYTQACGSSTRYYSCTNECGGTKTWTVPFAGCKECQTATNCGSNPRDCSPAYCQHCAPVITSWSPACGSQSRTCTDIDGACDGNDCAGVATSNCQHCAPTITSWTPACGDQTRTCTDNDGSCDGDDCAGVATSQCTECGPYIGAWSSCNNSHKRTRTCTENCGTNDCTALGAVAGVITEDCIGTIQGTLFDASDVSNNCTAGEIAASAKYGGQPFSIVPTPNALTWPIISGSAPTVTTNASGVYSQSVYGSATLPANYIFDYTNLFNSGLAAGIKTECGLSMAAVTTQSQVVTKNTGFWRVYGGWWQVVGGNVYAETGLKSNIPASILPLVSPFVNQKLILANADGRTGVLSHVFTWTGSELGTNPNAGVSSSLRRIESLYEGLRYDYDFYKTRMDVFASKPWVDTSISTYNDEGTGYQIFKKEGDLVITSGSEILVNNNKKVVLLVNGSVSINQSIRTTSGAFLSIIAKGNITFAANVTRADGWFVAESIRVPCADSVAPIGTCDKTDVQFDGQGSFVAWSGFTLNRDMYTGNNAAPSEKFTHRADLYLNAPAPMKVYSKKFSPFIP